MMNSDNESECEEMRSYMDSSFGDDEMDWELSNIGSVDDFIVGSKASDSSNEKELLDFKPHTSIETRCKRLDSIQDIVGGTVKGMRQAQMQWSSHVAMWSQRTKEFQGLEANGLRVEALQLENCKKISYEDFMTLYLGCLQFGVFYDSKEKNVKFAGKKKE